MRRILFFLFLFNSFLLFETRSQPQYTEQYIPDISINEYKTSLIASIDSSFLQRPADINKGMELSSLFLSKYKMQNRLSDTSIAHVMNVRANFFHMMNHFDSAKYYYTKAKKIYDFHGIHNSYVAYFLYRPLGILYHKTASFQEAINILSDASVILKKKNSHRIAAIYSEIGNIYQTTGNYRLALKYYQSAMNVQNMAKWMQGILHENMGLSLLHMEQYNQAEIHLKKSLDLALEDEDDIGVISVLSVLGEMFYKTDHIDEAISYINLALEKGRDIPGVDSRELAKIRYQLGIYLLESGHEDRALSEFEQILFSLQDETNSVLDPWLMISHKFMAKCYDKKYESSKDIQFLNLAFKQYEKSHQVAFQLRRSYHSDVSKLFLSGQTHDLYISAVENCYKLFQHSQDSSLLYKALQYSEFNKFQLHYEQMIQRMAFDTLKVSKNIKDNIGELKLKIAGIKKDIQILEHNNPAFTLDSLQELKLQLSVHYKELRKQKDILYSESGINLDYKSELEYRELQNFFEKNPAKCLLEFLTTDTSYYVFYMDHSGLQLKRFPSDQKGEKIKNLISQIQKRPNPTSDLNETKEMIGILSHVYNTILKDYLNSAKEIDHIILIPDQYWSFLSFEALLTNNRSKDWFNPEDFLVQNYSVTYSGSIALFFHSIEEDADHYENTYAGFAPLFKESNNTNSENLKYLEYSKSEIESANKILGGKTYLDSYASLSRFKKEVRKNQIIHLATHSEFDSLVPMNSKLYFSDSSIRLYEIYQMNTTAQLVILNACNTGIGKHYTGEGTMSVSNGFLESGSKACMMNLWSVDDYSTSQIVNHFITHLKANNNMYQSLRYAKITFLNNNRKLLHHPYYWASNVLTSRNEQPDKTNDKSLLKIFLGLSALLLIIMMILFRKKLQSKNLSSP